MKHRNTTVLAVLALVATLIPATVAAADEHISINEIRIDQPGGDTDEYFELTGPAEATLDGLTYLVIGDGSATAGSGVIESVTDLSGNSMPESGFFVAAEDTFTLGTADLVISLDFENSDNVTHLLVRGFSGADDDDLDTNDDGVLDVTPWTGVVDSVALVASPFSGDRLYSDTTVGPDGSFVPGHAYDCEEFGWLIGAFAPLGRSDTPGAPNPCEPQEMEIFTVQGSGGSSPFSGLLVTVTGVVIGDFQDTSSGELGVIFVQDGVGDSDASTSNGIFVVAPVPDLTDVAEGDVVEVTGLVGEPFGRTEINGFSITDTGDDASVVATDVTLPVGNTFEFEKYEGMLVTFPQTLFISEFFNFDRFGEIVLSTERQYQGTHVAEPGPAANAVTAANILARITLDDGRGNQNPDPAIHPNGEEFTLNNTFRGGDTVQNVTGAMDFAFGLYRIQPTQGAAYVNANPRPTDPDAVGGDVRVASFNVLNFFTHLDDGVNDICGPTGDMECRGADTAEELRRQLDKLVAGILALDADIVGIQEIENDIRDDEPVVPNRAHDPVLTLVEALNRVEGPGVWAWVGEANHYNDYPVRNDIIYRTSAVAPVGDPLALADEAFDRTRPETPDEPVGRPPLSQTFREIVDQGSRQPFAVVVNHFKSKGSSCASIGDPDTGDGQGNCNLTRVAQSEALLDFVDDLSEDSSGVLVMGDLNSYATEDPITTLEEAGLTDLVERYEGADAYSYVFDGQLGYLDTALATRSMLNRVTGTTVFHINADEPDILDYDTSFKQDAQDALYEPLPYRVSDHDPVIVGLDFPGPGVGGPEGGPPFTPPGPPPGRGNPRFR